jgi:hypothetical protein
MDQPFKITFDFPVANSDLVVSLTATAQLHHSEPYYVVQDFYFEDANPGKTILSVLPPQELKTVRRGGAEVWVHRDSERESLLGSRIGKAIEETLDKK